MAIGANSYSSVAEVAAFTPLYATAAGQTFDANTRPTLTQVEKFIDQVSGMVNSILAKEGFDVPVIQADAALAIDGFVAIEVAGWVEYANGAGPFIQSAQNLRASTPARIILKDCEEFIDAQAIGFEALGALRNRRLTQGLDAEDIETPLWDTDWSG